MLKGSLDGFALPELFRLMSQSKKTGRLDVTRSAGRGQVYFREGLIYYATSSLSTAPLGRKLVELGALTERRLAKALDQHALTGERVGEILLQSGAISEDQLEAAIRLQIEDAVFDLMRWDLGEFSWQPGVAVATEVPIRLRVEELVVEASRRIDELEVIQAKVPSPDAVMTLSAEAPRAHPRVSMTPAEWKVLVLVDGHRTVAEIAGLAQLQNEDAMQILHGLTSAGLIELSHETATPDRRLEVAPPPQAPPEPLKGLLDGPRPSYDLLGGPGPELEGEGADLFLRPAPDELEPDESRLLESDDSTSLLESDDSTDLLESDDSLNQIESDDSLHQIESDDSTDRPAPDDSSDPFERVLDDPRGWPEGPSPQALDDWFSDAGTTFEGFDLPGPGELVTEEPADDPAVGQSVGREPGQDPAPGEFVLEEPADAPPGKFAVEETADARAPGEFVLEEPGEGSAPGEFALEEPAGDQAAEELVTEDPGDEQSVVEGEDIDAAASLDPRRLGSPEDDLGESLPAETNGLLTSAPTDGAEAFLASSDPLEEAPREGMARKRVEDDDRVTKGLINRLIEGLKGH